MKVSDPYARPFPRNDEGRVSMVELLTSKRD
jgi:hypothetical protein